MHKYSLLLILIFTQNILADDHDLAVSKIKSLPLSKKSEVLEKNDFNSRLMPAVMGGGFYQKDYWIWCGSVIKGEDDRYHMFASRWNKKLGFHPHWLTNSEIVRAESKRPEGPYEFKEVVLPARGSEYWDGKMTHNPAIRKVGNKYVLWYTGTTYDELAPNPDNPTTKTSPLKLHAHKGERIGVAISNSVKGPWTRYDMPVLDIGPPGSPDGYLVSNASPVILSDGTIKLFYKAVKELGKNSVAVATAQDPKGPYVKSNELAININAEDPNIWYEDGQYHALLLDYGRKYSEKEIIYATSSNLSNWELANPAIGVGKNILWSDGIRRKSAFTERPHVLVEDGKATHVFFAAGTGGHELPTDTWNQVIPLSKIKK